MPEFAVLTNRKRTVVALVHSIFFLLLAIWNTVKAGYSVGLFFALVRHGHEGRGSAIAMTLVYGIVTGVLLWLVSLSRCAVERAYFAFCATSASFGLLRTLVGSVGMQPAQYIRVSMLSAAVVTGMFILRMYGADEVGERAMVAEMGD